MTCFQCGGPDLVMRFRAGERDALESVYRAYVDLVSRTVANTLRQLGGDHRRRNWKVVGAELPDLVQEVFTRAFDPRSRLAFDTARPYGPYLGQIARNASVDHLRRQRARRSLGGDGRLNHLRAESNDPTSEGGLADPRTVTAVDDYIAALPPNLREVHEALYVRGLSQRAAAASLGVGRQVLRTLERRLRDGLREQLREIEMPPSRTVASAIGSRPSLRAADRR